MDSNGFAPEGLAPPKLRLPPTRIDAAKSAIYAANQLHEKPDGEQRVIGTLHAVKSVTWGLWLVQFLAILLIPVATVVGWMGWKSGAAGLRSFLSAPVRSLMHTPINEVDQLRNNTMRSAADVSRLHGAAERGHTIDGKLEKRMAEAKLKPAAAPKASWLDNLSKDHWFARRLHRFTEGRVNAHAPKVTKAIDALHEQISGIVNKPAEIAAAAAKKGKPVDVAAHATAQKASDLYKPVHELLEKAKTAATPAEKANLLQQAEDTAHKISQGLVGKDSKAAQEIRDAIKVARRSAGYLAGHMDALKGGARAQFSNLMRIGGRIPVFYAVLAAGLAVGTIGAALSTRRENRLAKEAVQQMKDDVGDEHHPMVQEAGKIAKTQAGRRWIGAGLSTVGDGAMLMPINSMVGGMAMMGMTQLPTLGQNIMPQNQPLSAYMMLKKAEAGKMQLQPKQRVELLTHLVTAVPAFSKQGGMDNRLAAPVAVEIAKREMNVRDTMRFLANPDQFMEVVKTAAAQQKTLDDAAAAEKAVNEKADATKPADKTDAAKPGVDTTAVAATPGEKPAATVAAAKGTVQGRVVDFNRAVGQA